VSSVRRLVRIPICLALGALEAVAVAWGLALVHGAAGPVVGQEFATLTAETQVWQLETTRRGGFAVVRSFLVAGGMFVAGPASPAGAGGPSRPRGGGDEARRQAPSWGGGDATAPRWCRPRRRSDAAPGGVYLDSAWGWPMLAMRAELRGSPWIRSQVTALRGAIPLGRGARHPPLLLLPGGLAVDAVVFGCMTMAVWEAAGRGASRRRRPGACLRCGYDLRGGEARRCPECGWERRSEGAVAGKGQPPA
jgi:hypothetical protein